MFGEKKEIESAELGWSSAVVMICSKCGAQFSDPEKNEAPERIKKDLKKLTKENLGKSVRVITTSCLNICPVDKIAVVVAKNNAEAKAYNVSPDVSGDDLYKKILS